MVISRYFSFQELDFLYPAHYFHLTFIGSWINFLKTWNHVKRGIFTCIYCILPKSFATVLYCDHFNIFFFFFCAWFDLLLKWKENFCETLKRYIFESFFLNIRLRRFFLIIRHVTRKLDEIHLGANLRYKCLSPRAENWKFPPQGEMDILIFLHHTLNVFIL